MPQIDEKTLRALVENNVHIRLLAMPRSLDLKGYIVLVDTGRADRSELIAKRGHVRVFKRLETLQSFCVSLGLSGFEVQVS